MNFTLYMLAQDIIPHSLSVHSFSLHFSRPARRPAIVLDCNTDAPPCIRRTNPIINYLWLSCLGIKHERSSEKFGLCIQSKAWTGGQARMRHSISRSMHKCKPTVERNTASRPFRKSSTREKEEAMDACVGRRLRLTKLTFKQLGKINCPMII